MANCWGKFRIGAMAKQPDGNSLFPNAEIEAFAAAIEKDGKTAAIQKMLDDDNYTLKQINDAVIAKIPELAAEQKSGKLEADILEAKSIIASSSAPEAEKNLALRTLRKDFNRGDVTLADLRERFVAKVAVPEVKEPATPENTEEPESNRQIDINQMGAQYNLYETDTQNISEAGGKNPPQGQTKERIIRAAKALQLKETATTPGIYYVTAKLEKVGERQLPAKITTAQEAADATAYLSRSAVEHYDAIVTDKDGKVLAVIGSFKGSATQASVFPSTLTQELAKIEGAANVWASHNHPSGKAVFSSSDKTLSSATYEMLRGSGVNYRGLLAIANKKYVFMDNANSLETSGTIQPYTGKMVKAPIAERVIEGSPLDEMTINNPGAAKLIVPQISNNQPGIVFLSAQHAPVSFVPINPSEIFPLRKDGRLMKLFRAAADTGASAAMVSNPNNEIEAQHIDNLAAALQIIDIRLLDSIGRGGASLESTRGINPHGAFLSRAQSNLTNLTPSKIIEALRNSQFVGKIIDKLLARGDKGQRGGVVIGKDIEDVQKLFEEKTGRELGDDVLQSVNVDEYGGNHRPPNSESGAPLHDLTGAGEIYPDDIYSSNAAQYYGHFGRGNPIDRRTIFIIQSLRNKPDEEVTIYRAVPNAKTGADLSSEEFSINDGDWVTINRDYAKDHGEGPLRGKYKIVSKKVKAREVFTSGDSIHEFGYWKDGKPVDIPGIRYSKDGVVQGLYDPKSGLTFLISNHLTAETAPSVLLHETIHAVETPEMRQQAVTMIEQRNSPILPSKLRQFLNEVYAKIPEESGGGVLQSVSGYNIEQSLLDRLGEIHPDVDAFLSIKGDTIKLTELQMPKAIRSEGIGSRFMEILTKYADSNGMTIALTAAGDFGGSRAGQERFYKRFEFVANKGRNKDYRIIENMLRRPQQGIRLSKTGTTPSTSAKIESEVSSYIVEHALNVGRQAGFSAIDDTLFAHLTNKLGKRVSDFVRAWVAKVRAYLFKRGIVTKLYVDDFIALAQSGLKQAARGEVNAGGGVVSGSRDTPISDSQGMPLFSKSGQPNPEQSDQLPEETKLEATRRVGQDAMLRFKVMQDWLAEKGVKISEAANVYQKENLSKATTANKIEDFRQFERDPLIEKIAKGGFKLSDIADYLEAVHIPEANERMRDIHKDPDATANGVTDKEAEQVVDKYKAMPDFVKFKTLANEVRAIGERALEMRLANKLISQEQYDAYKATYKQWIPLRGDMSKQGFGKGLSTNAKQKRRFGHEGRESEHIIENLMKEMEMTIFQIEHNKMGLAVAQFLLEANDPRIGTFAKPVKQSVMKDHSYAVSFEGNVISSFETMQAAQAFVLKTVNSKSGAIQGLTLTAADFDIEKTYDPHVALMVKPMLAENEIQVYIDGHVVRIQLNDPLLARAATNAGIEQLAGILYMARQFNNFLSKAYTAWSPDFLVVNPVRDVYQGSATLTGKRGAKFTLKAFAKYVWAWKELWKAHNDTRKSQWVTDYRTDGGNTGAAYMSDIDRIGKDTIAAFQEVIGAKATYDAVYEEQIAKGASDKKARTVAALKATSAGYKKVPAFGHLLRLMERLNGVFENTLRLAAYRTAIESGETGQSAAMLAKDLMNFNRKGEIANQMGALYLFYNPAAQGVHVFAEALLTSPHKNEARWIAGGMVMAAFLLAELGRGGDDEDERDWRNIPDYVKARNLVVKMGDTQATIPVAYGFGIFNSMGNAISDVLHGVDSQKVSLEMATSAFENFSVFGNPLVEQNGKVEFHPEQLTPTAIKMVTAPASNLDSLGRRIAPIKYRESAPDSENMTRSMRGSWYAEVAATMNDWTGGSAYEPGAVDVSPNVLQYWVRSLLGGAGRFAGDALDITTGGMQGVTPELERVPVVRKFIRTSDVADSRSAFWHVAQKAKIAAEQYRDAVREGDKVAAQGMGKDNQALINFAKRAGKDGDVAGEKRNAIEQVKNSTLSAGEKKLKIARIEKEEQEIYDKFLSAFDKRQ